MRAARRASKGWGWRGKGGPTGTVGVPRVVSDRNGLIRGIETAG